MKFDKYALATEIEDNSNLFEIFDIIIVDGDSDISKRWKPAASTLRAVAMDVTNYDNVAYNSIWDGTKFTLPDNHSNIGSDIFDVWSRNEGSINHALMLDNKVFGKIVQHLDSLQYNKYKAAFSNKVVVIDVTDMKSFGLGYIWNGSEVLPPQ